jgi:hypothetical protein
MQPPMKALDEDAMVFRLQPPRLVWRIRSLFVRDGSREPMRTGFLLGGGPAARWLAAADL